MFARCHQIALAIACCLIVQGVRGDDKKPYSGTACTAPVDDFFKDEVWAKLGVQKCLTCHKEGADAEDSKFLLIDPRKKAGSEQDAAMRQNREAFARMARLKEKDESRILLKVVGKLDHGGKDVLPIDSAGYRILQAFVRRLNTPVPVSVAIDPKAPPFFQGVTMMDGRRLLRRATLSLAGRLPSSEELAAVSKDGLKAMPAILDGVMKEEAFYDRLREGFNDIFLTIGFDGNPEQSVLSYNYFPQRLWYQSYDFSQIKDEGERRRAGYKLSGQYREAIRGESMKLIEHIVRNDRPFTEIVTADYMMVTPYSAKGYGVFDIVKDKFKDANDPFEYVPVQLKALVGRNKTKQESATGFYPHAGMLSLFQYLRRYPTTETNRNRLRSRMYYQHFLGIDVLELAARVSDAAAAQAKYEVPTMQAAECVVCHRTLDPVAGLFQDYWDFEGTYGLRKGGWFKDMFVAGFEGEDLPPSERWRALQWLGQRTAKDPRFAVAMVEHVYYILTGRKVLLPPKDIEDPLYNAKLRAYQEQRKQIEAIAMRFSRTGFNLRSVFKDWVVSEFYRADGVATSIADARRRAELDDAGLVHLLAPEQLDRKVRAIFGERWAGMNEQTELLYGGIDSRAVTERATDPSGAMGAIQRILANDVACKNVGRDFGKPPSERKLFPHIEPSVVPGGSAEGDAALRKAIVYLHERILGRLDSPDSAEVTRTLNVLTGIVADAHKIEGLNKLDNYTCRQGSPQPPADPHYTIRAWRGVVTYLLRRHEFLYE